MLGMLFYAPHGLWAAFSGLITLLASWEYSSMAKLGEGVKRPYLVGTALWMLIAYLGHWF